jgi:hypothetical protein
MPDMEVGVGDTRFGSRSGKMPHREIGNGIGKMPVLEVGNARYGSGSGRRRV